MEAAGQAVKEKENARRRIGGFVLDFYFPFLDKLLLHRIDGQLEFCFEQKERVTMA